MKNDKTPAPLLVIKVDSPKHGSVAISFDGPGAQFFHDLVYAGLIGSEQPEPAPLKALKKAIGASAKKK